MKSRTIFWLIALVGIFTFFSCGKGNLYSAKERVSDSLSYYNSQLTKAKEYLYVGQYDSSNYLVHQFLDAEERLPCNNEMLQMKSQAYNILGCNKAYSNKKEAIELYKKACTYAIQSHYAPFLYGVYTNLADAYSQSGDIVDGIFYYHKSLLLADSLNLPQKDRFLIYYGLGLAYLELRDFEQSDYYNELAGQQYEWIDPFNQWLYLNRKANYYYYKEEYQAALPYVLKARKLVESHPEMNNERSECYVNLADLYLKLGQLDSTEVFLSKSRPFFEQSHHLSGIYYIETLQIQLALRRGELSKAYALLNKPVEDRIVTPDMLVVRQKSLQLYHEEVGNHREALRNLKAYNRLDDSIRSERVSNRVAEISMRYKQDTLLLKKTGLIQKQQAEMGRWKLLVVTCVALFLASVMAILYFRKKKEYLQIRYHNRVTELQMETIRNRIFPHFIFNTLMTEIATFEEQDSHRSRLQKLLSLLKQTLRQTETLALTLREELDFVQNYVDWAKLSLDGEFDFTVEWDDKVDPDAVFLLAMMIQLPVENAIKHALRGKIGKKELVVKIQSSENVGTVIYIRDNGPGFGAQMQKGLHHTGTGLRVLTQTIQLLNSKNKEEIYFHISNLKESDRIIGCQVEMMIPHHYSYQLKR